MKTSLQPYLLRLVKHPPSLPSIDRASKGRAPLHTASMSSTSRAATASAAEEESRDARRLLAKAPTILRKVDECDLLVATRKYPTFDLAEVKVGPLLGSGGYCDVYEVLDFEWAIHTTEAKTIETSGVHSVESAKNKNDAPKTKHKKTPSVSFSQDTADLLKEKIPEDRDQLEDDPHYEIDGARKLMKEQVRRNGEARYAIKRLKALNEADRARGMIDLAIEAKYLSALWHPNIVKMRAQSTADLLDRNFFLVMDRLFDTLALRVRSWRATYQKSKGGLFGLGAKPEELSSLMTERMIVAYDLSNAFRYMHENGLVYRDIRKENIGFDVRGDIKVFDFGLSKSLSPALKAKDSKGKPVYGYNLTPRTGSIPFMAPEIVEQQPYDEKCDVFSFAILLWEILALKPAFGGGLSPREYRERVVFRRERPPIKRGWPPITSQLIKESWDENPQKRPEMKRVAAMLRGDLNSMTKDISVQRRTLHMRNRSAHSLRLETRKFLTETERPDMGSAFENSDAKGD